MLFTHTHTHTHKGISISGEAASNSPGSWNHGAEDELLNIKNIQTIILSLFKKGEWVK